MPNARSPLSEITAVILAGGRGTRLKSVVADRPKVLANVAGRPFLSFLLDQLAYFGAKNVVLSTGYMAETIEAAFGENYAGMRLFYSREIEPLGTGGALRQALQFVHSPTLLAMNGDSFCNADFNALITHHRRNNAAGTLTLTRVENVSRYGEVQAGTSDAILAFKEKQTTATGAGWINAGIYALARDLIESLPPNQQISLEREVFPQHCGNGLYGFHSDGDFIDIGTPESYAKAQRLFANAQFVRRDGGSSQQ